MIDLQKMKKSTFWLMTFGIAIVLAAVSLYLTCLLKMASVNPLNVSYNPIVLKRFVDENGFPRVFFYFVLACFEIPLFAFFPKMASRSGVKDVLGRDFYTSDDNCVYGDAHFEKPEEYEDAALVQDVDDAYGTIFGQITKDGSEVINFRVGENRLNSHILAVGASGSGKTFTFTKPFAYQCIKRRESVIFTDPDGGLTRDLSNLFREHGYIVRVFDLKNPRKSDGWNCMGSINKSENKDLAAHLFADAIISNIPGSTNTQPIFHDGPLALLKALLLRVSADDKGMFKEKTIREVYGILQNKGGEEYLNTIFDPELLAGSDAEISLGSYNSFKLASDNLRGNLITSLATSLSLLQAGPIADMLSTDGIDLTLPGKQPCAYFCKFPDSHDTYRFIVSLFFSMLFMELVDYADNDCGEKLPVPVNFMLDEFPSIGKLPDFQRKMATIRKRNMNVAMIIQDITQLQDLYEDAATTLISNCSTFFSLGINDEYTANLVTKRIGETTVEVQTKQHREIESVFTIFNKHSEGQGKRAVLSFDELFKLDKDDCLIMFQGHNPIHAHKYPHTLHPFSKNIVKYDMKNRANITDKEARRKEYEEEAERVAAYLKKHPLENFDRSYSFVFEEKKEQSLFDKLCEKIKQKIKEKEEWKEAEEEETPMIDQENQDDSEQFEDEKPEEAKPDIAEKDYEEDDLFHVPEFNVEPPKKENKPCKNPVPGDKAPMLGIQNGFGTPTEMKEVSKESAKTTDDSKTKAKTSKSSFNLGSYSNDNKGAEQIAKGARKKSKSTRK